MEDAPEIDIFFEPQDILRTRDDLVRNSRKHHNHRHQNHLCILIEKCMGVSKVSVCVGVGVRGCEYAVWLVEIMMAQNATMHTHSQRGYNRDVIDCKVQVGMQHEKEVLAARRRATQPNVQRLPLMTQKSKHISWSQQQPTCWYRGSGGGSRRESLGFAGSSAVAPAAAPSAGLVFRSRSSDAIVVRRPPVPHTSCCFFRHAKYIILLFTVIKIYS